MLSRKIRNPFVSSLTIIIMSLMFFSGCGQVAGPTAPQKSSLETGTSSNNIAVLSKPSGIDLPNIDINFCPDNVAITTELSTDNDAGVTWASSVFLSAAGGNVGIFFRNDGPGSIEFANPSWSVKGTDLAKGVDNPISLTPSGSSATFNDFDFGGEFGEGVSILGCIDLSSFSLSRGKQGTAHLDLSFMRGGTIHTVRVNVHLR